MTHPIPSISPKLRGRAIVPVDRIGHTGEHHWFARAPRTPTSELTMVRGRALPAVAELFASITSVGGAMGYAAVLATAVLTTGFIATTSVQTHQDASVVVSLTRAVPKAPAAAPEPSLKLDLPGAQLERGQLGGYAIGAGSGDAPKNLFDAHMSEIARLTEQHPGTAGRVELEVAVERGRVRSVAVMPSTTAPDAFVDDLVRRAQRWTHGPDGRSQHVLVLR